MRRCILVKNGSRALTISADGGFMSENSKTKKLVMCAILSAIIIVLQFLGSFIKFGPFSVTLVLVPIVVGVALCGRFSGAWLGLLFGAAVLISGDAAPFMAVSPFGTVLTVLVKGTLCGYAAELVYGALKKNRYWAIFVSAIVCPVVNTGVFLIGCKLFFMELITQWAEALGFGSNVGLYMITVLVGGNFIFEVIANIILSPVIVRLTKLLNLD